MTKAEYARQRARKLRKQSKCVACTEPTNGYKYCEKHRQQANGYRRKIVTGRREKGLCVKCSQPSERYYCRGCQEYMNQAVRMYRERRRDIA